MYFLNRKKTVTILIIVAFIIIAGVSFSFWSQSNRERIQQTDETEVETFVTNFGQTLKNVSLLSPTAAEDIEINYKDFLDQLLLTQWQADPLSALGRLTSSPWPDSIEVSNVSQLGSDTYKVDGKIIDMTSTGMAGSRPVQIKVTKSDEQWTITEILIISPEEGLVWREYSGDGINFQYPEELGVQYISALEWPPTIEVASENFFCAETPQGASSVHEITSQRVIDDCIYCINVKNEGAAGSVYTSYTYKTPLRGKIVSIDFVLRYNNCGNYDENQRQACWTERESFNVDKVISHIAQTVIWDSSFSENTLANQISQCLMSSSSVNHERCDELLAEVTDFDSCVMAGFQVLESNPVQCLTIDERTFSQESNSAWDQAVLAISNCEVEKVFQAHSRIVTLTLKNGQTLIAQEPRIDDVMTLVGIAESECGAIPIATE